MIDKSVVAEAVARHIAAGSSKPNKAAAVELGINHNTVRRIMHQLRHATEASADAPAPATPKAEPYKRGGSPADRKIIQLEDELHRLRQELKIAHRSSLDEDAAREILRTVSLGETKVPGWVDQLRTSSGSRSPEAPMTMWTDFHGGERVSRAEVNGVNEYSIAIMDARFERLVNRTVDLCQNHGPGNYPGVIVNLGGDFVSGALHPELAKTDELEILPTVLHMRDLLIGGLKRMADQFGHVYAPSVAGNHGRGTPKPEFKRYFAKNFDWIIYELVKRYFAETGDDRVVIDTRPANEVFYSVYGRRFLLMHGDMLGVKGGDGIIGSIGPIMRGEIKTRGSAASSGMEYDTLLMGHWHQQLWLPRAIVSNCLKGYDEYAKNGLRAPISPPTQPLWFVHPKFGITSKWDVHVDEPTPPVQADWVAVFDPAKEAA